MISVLLVLGTITMYCASTLAMKSYQVSAGPGHFQIAFMNVVLSGAGFVGFIAFKGFTLHYNTVTLILAIVFGVGLWVYNTLKIKAASCGPMAILSMSYVIGGVTIPALYGILVLGELVILHKIAGILLIFLSFVPLLLKSRHQMVFTVKFWVLCILLLVLNGVLMTVSKVAQLNSQPEYSMDYVALYYFFFFLMAIGTMVKDLHRPDAYDLKVTLTLPHFLMAAAAGLFNAVGSVFNYLLSFRMPASVQFPLTQSSMLVVITVMSLILYREKPSRETILSLLITIASIVLISI
ncbi:MAG: hypothetical protein IJZ13_00750 [Clostridia bacterium]|nr:hypothetical protein [Clostridia bacterium]